jgi:Protein of unknown function (DUF707)
MASISAGKRQGKPGLGISRSLTELIVGSVLVFALVLFAISRLLPHHDGDGAPTKGRGLTSSAGILDKPTRSSDKRFLVVSSSSCEDIAPPKRWLYDRDAPVNPYYDVVLFDYSAANTCKKYVDNRPGFTLIHRPKTFKWPAMRHFFLNTEEGRRALLSYDYFMLADDDVDFHTLPEQAQSTGAFRLMTICEVAGLHICQPTLSAQSAINFASTAHVTKGQLKEGGIDEKSEPEEVSPDEELDELNGPEARVRLTNFAEQMTPVLSREGVMQLLPYFGECTHCWGIDVLWSDFSERLGKKVGVIDSVIIDHMRKSGVSNLYKRVGGIDKAKADQDIFKAKWGLREEIFTAAHTFGAGETIMVPNLPAEKVEEEAVAAAASKGGSKKGKKQQ